MYSRTTILPVSALYAPYLRILLIVKVWVCTYHSVKRLLIIFPTLNDRSNSEFGLYMTTEEFYSGCVAKPTGKQTIVYRDGTKPPNALHGTNG